jgi:tripartite-type tricarboxylate transporter receptor subunit TctC
MITRRHLLTISAATPVSLLALRSTFAQAFPAKPIKIVVPFPPGGTADGMPRIVADWLSRKWGHPVIIENKSGAAGNVGAEAAAKSDPDGYTLLSAPPPPLVINQNLYPKLGYNPLEFVPIIIMGRVPNALMAEYYRQRSSAGLIISEATSVDPMGVGYADTPGIWSDEQVRGWSQITDAVHDEGGRIFLQLWHVGRMSDPMFLDG